MKISVIIPVYNGEQYVAWCLDGMMRQTYGELEVIVVDDGSTDSSLAIARDYEGRGVRIVEMGRNRGLSAARNAGMEAATGEYIHFMDVDDAINDEFYQRLAEAVVATGADVACCGMVNEPKPHRTLLFDEQRVLTTTDDKMRTTNVGQWSFVWRYLLRAEMLREHDLRFEEGRLVEDMAFSIPAVYFARTLVVVPGAVYTYMLRPGSIMQTRSRAHRRRRHRDHRHAKTMRHNFARSHGFRIPGVPTRLGPLSLFYVKWFT
ncbi:MAG: glycosyltransferase [Alistipes sp.]|jgi:cellulose synthase/poly-beta-1,6-N-acetylglucosamine synthase-like glycosyltransferase|nr:glycosyltransferase [Alistipes sp.]